MTVLLSSNLRLSVTTSSPVALSEDVALTVRVSMGVGSTLANPEAAAAVLGIPVDPTAPDDDDILVYEESDGKLHFEELKVDGGEF